MPDLYPLLLLPDFRERVWGARKLSPLYPNYHVGEQPIGEVWLTGDDNQIANGPLAGQTLSSICARHPRELLGGSAGSSNGGSAGNSKNDSRFPLLMKFLFPTDKLSVQVHPDDEEARHAGLPCGKTECWYVVEAGPDAEIALGLKPGTSREQVTQAIEKTHLEELLIWNKIKKGEMYYVDAGTVHAIAPGSVLLETQQNSDTTYRLYDYGRGRELHIDQALHSMKPHTLAGRAVAQAINVGQVNLISTRFFAVDKVTVNQPQDFSTASGCGGSSVQCLVALDGCGVVDTPESQPVSFAKGEAVVVPAATGNFRIRPQWTLELLRATVPAGEVAESQIHQVGVGSLQ